jgi:hypothetical protein
MAGICAAGHLHRERRKKGEVFMILRILSLIMERFTVASTTNRQ